MVYSTDRSKKVVPVLVLPFVALWFILRGDLFYVLLCIILFLCLFSPFSIAITSLGEERANLGAFRTFVRFVLVWNCRFPLPLGVWEGLRFVIVALPGLFSYLFCLTEHSPGLSQDSYPLYERQRQKTYLRTCEPKDALRKHVYSNILKILPPKNENFQIKKCLYFAYFCSKHRLWVLVRTALARQF